MAQTEAKGMMPNKDPLAWDIATVLRSLGGSAHQTVVIDCVTALQRQRGLEVRRQDMASRIIEVFEHYRDMFFRPFGEGSQRWALAPGFAAA
ncbi:hypothetical protein JIP62_13200 [Brevundimonas vitis]|uniref:Uncharacterized protein n=1 Tax=Brevundimonas vitisensis TaxID=2800818 RepID=A0ABX7BKZ8_9CAUL|nr:hypothetical protein [Brevundimonas vitisensis]QQQ18245.1 hypothetical protein JIP62_13200 [Brevundimonas vitisensis]